MTTICLKSRSSWCLMICEGVSWMLARSNLPGNKAIASPNPPSDPLSPEASEQARARHCESQEFIRAIRDELMHGYGFVPFIGAGFSVSAGIPIIEQLRHY